jgi:hypothetical protein
MCYSSFAFVRMICPRSRVFSHAGFVTNAHPPWLLAGAARRVRRTARTGDDARGVIGRDRFF